MIPFSHGASKVALVADAVIHTSGKMTPCLQREQFTAGGLKMLYFYFASHMRIEAIFGVSKFTTVNMS